MSTESDPAEASPAAVPASASVADARPRLIERHGWQRAVFEVALLIASAMIALAVNDWTEERERSRLAQRVLLELKLEIEQNQQAIVEALPYHEKMYDGFRASRQALNKGEPWEYPAAFDGLNQILFQRAAYDSALLSQTLPHLDSRTLSAISALYTQQEEYTQNLRMFAAATLQTDDKDSRRDLRLTENCFKQMASSERRLMVLLDKAKAAVSTELGGVPATAKP